MPFNRAVPLKARDFPTQSPIAPDNRRNFLISIAEGLIAGLKELEGPNVADVGVLTQMRGSRKIQAHSATTQNLANRKGTKMTGRQFGSRLRHFGPAIHPNQIPNLNLSRRAPRSDKTAETHRRRSTLIRRGSEAILDL